MPLASLRVTFPSHDHYVVGDSLARDYLTGNAGLAIGAARNALRRTFRSKSVQTQGISCSTNRDRKSTRLNSSHEWISYAVFCLKKKIKEHNSMYSCRY